MRGEDERARLAGSGEERVKVGNIVAERMWLRNRGRQETAALEVDILPDRGVRAVVEAHARELRDGGENRGFKLRRFPLAAAEGVVGKSLDRVVRLERIGPYPAGLPAARDEHHGRCAGSAAFEIHLAAAADIDEAGEVRGRRGRDD